MANGTSQLGGLSGDATRSFDSMEGLTPPKAIRREASVVSGVDIGGKGIKVRIQCKDGRVGEAAVDTPTPDLSRPVSDRVDTLADAVSQAIFLAAGQGGVQLSEVDAIGVGAPGSRDPRTGEFRMPNAIGRDEGGELAPVDLEGAVRERLRLRGFRSDAVLRGGNDCDVAAAATNLGEVVVVKRGVGDNYELEGNEKSFFALLGTGIGVGWATRNGIDEGASGAVEGGHVRVHNDITDPRANISCGCGKGNHPEICVEAISSTTGQERVTNWLVRKALGENSFDERELRLLLTETQRWNREKLGRATAESDVARYETSIRSIDAVLRGLHNPRGVVEAAESIVYDAEVVDRLAVGERPQVALAADAMEISGRHFGRFLEKVIYLNNPKRVVIGGGGGMTFKHGDENTNPFWRGMMSQLQEDPHKAIENCWIIAVVDKSVNLGIQGSMEFARIEYERGQKAA